MAQIERLGRRVEEMLGLNQKERNQLHAGRQHYQADEKVSKGAKRQWKGYALLGISTHS
jgi:hypothetical protein